MPMPDRRSLLADPEFRALLGARLTWALAISALMTVVGFQTYELTGDPLALGWLGLVEAIPALALVLFGGHLADRRDRRAIIIVTSLVTALCAAALAALSSSGSLGLAGILGVIFVVGTATGFERPAFIAFEAQIIPRAQATRGVGFMSTVTQTGLLAGPVAGGVGIAIWGLAAAYGAIAVLLAVSAICVASISIKPMPGPVAGEPLLESLLAGIRYVWRSPILIGSMALDLFAVFFGGAIAILPVFAADILGVGPAGLGILRTAPSLGALVAMLVATRRPPSRQAGRTLLVCVAGFGVSMIVFGLSTTFWISVVALFMSGVTDGVSVVIRMTILRILSPEHLRARIASVNWVFISASSELGAFESGVAARLFGTVPSVVGGGLLTLVVVAVVAVAVPSLRRLDLETAGPPDDLAAPAQPAGVRQPDAEQAG
jgi:MFS family permease